MMREAMDRAIGASYDHRTSPCLPDAKPAKQTRALDTDSPREAQGTGRPHVCFTLRRVRLFDVDAKWSSVKDLLDGLQIAQCIPGDREDQITLEVRQEKVAHFADESTIIQIEYP